MLIIRVLHPVVGPVQPPTQVQLLGLVQFPPLWQPFVHTAIKCSIGNMREIRTGAIRVVHPVVGPPHPSTQVQLLGWLHVPPLQPIEQTAWKVVRNFNKSKKKNRFLRVVHPVAGPSHPPEHVQLLGWLHVPPLQPIVHTAAKY
jgi:hypothetical protein